MEELVTCWVVLFLVLEVPKERSQRTQHKITIWLSPFYACLFDGFVLGFFIFLVLPLGGCACGGGASLASFLFGLDVLKPNLTFDFFLGGVFGRFRVKCPPHATLPFHSLFRFCLVSYI